MTFTTVTRVAKGTVRNVSEWLVYSGKDHVHHRLVQLGLGRLGAVIALWIVSALLGLVALAV
jgi:UDP-GlcNAc:undecaprenyl-phosphate GlcNAc-1-phosphate transferase